MLFEIRGCLVSLWYCSASHSCWPLARVYYECTCLYSLLVVRFTHELPCWSWLKWKVLITQVEEFSVGPCESFFHRKARFLNWVVTLVLFVVTWWKSLFTIAQLVEIVSQRAPESVISSCWCSSRIADHNWAKICKPMLWSHLCRFQSVNSFTNLYSLGFDSSIQFSTIRLFSSAVPSPITTITRMVDCYDILILMKLVVSWHFLKQYCFNKNPVTFAESIVSYFCAFLVSECAWDIAQTRSSELSSPTSFG